MSIRLWQPLVINRRGGNGGGGGGDVVVKKNAYYIDADTSKYIASGQGSSYITSFNIDNNKCIWAQGGYGSGLRIISLQETSVTTISTVSNLVPYQEKTTIAEDDSFFIYWHNNAFYYVPVNSDYTAGTEISVNTTDLGYSANTRKPFILSPTRFGFYDYNNLKIGIFKLENGALVEDKSIDCSTFNLVGGCVSSFAGKIVLLTTKTSGTLKPTGIRIIDPDTEETLYEDIRDDQSNTPNSCYQKDNYLFVYNDLNSQPYITERIFVYEYSNGQFSKKNMSTVGYTPRQSSNSITIRVYKQSEGVYIVYSIGYSSVSNLDISFFVCDITNGTVEGNFYYTKGSTIFPCGFNIVTVNNKQKLLLSNSYSQSYYTYYRWFYGNYHLDKIPTQIQYQGSIFDLTEFGE